MLYRVDYAVSWTCQVACVVYCNLPVGGGGRARTSEGYFGTEGEGVGGGENHPGLVLHEELQGP